MTLGDRWPPQRVLDPSCGDGAILAAATRRGLPCEAVCGRDNDPSAIAVAQAALPGAALEVVDLFASRSGGRFDAVVGNPPYVRGDRLTSATKERIAECLGGDYARGDLAAAALLRSVSFLCDGGRLGFVVSAALLEADYAAPLWMALAKLGAVREIIAAPAERWFAEAAVNTIIVVFERGGSGPTRLSKLRKPTDVCAAAVSKADELSRVAEIHIDTSGSPRRWAQLLRAPSLWLELECSPALVALGEIAKVRRGLTSGANDIFYLSAQRAAAESIEPKALTPLVRSPPKSGDVSIAIDPSQLRDFVLRAPDDLSGAPRARAYLERNADAAQRPTLAGRQPWWKLPKRPARLFLAKAYARRFVQRLSPTPLECDQRVYAVWPEAGLDVELLAAILNSSLTALAIEALGRASMGQGALEWTVGDARRLPVVDPRRLSAEAKAAIVSSLRSMAGRSIGNSAAEAERADRRALDQAVFAVDPLLAAHGTMVAAAVAEASSARELRARS